MPHDKPFWRSPFRKVSDVPQYVPGVGPIPCKIMLIGERPGDEEAYHVPPRPFIGLAGKYLDILLSNAGLDRQHVYLTNLVKTFDRYSKPTIEEVQRDSGILAEELIAVRPVVVGLLGTFAVEHILGRERAGLERTHGIPVSVSGADAEYGFHRSWPKAVYIPMLHPGGIIYDIGAMPNVQSDFDRIAKCLEEYEETGKIEIVTDRWAGREVYTVQPRDRQFEVRLDCAIDTEGWRRRPWCATFSTGYGMANLTYPGTPVVVSSELVYLHNSLHDLGVLRTLGIGLGDSQFRDTMVWAYLLCIEPQGLKDLAYRHFGMEMQSYDEVIGEADRNRALEYLIGADAYGWKKIEPYVQIERDKKTREFVPKINKPQSINQRIRRILNDCDSKGEACNPRTRWNNIDDYIKQEVVETLGEMPGATLDDVPRAKAEYYACRDADTTRRIGPVLQQKISSMDLDRISEIDHGIIPMVDRMQDVGWEIADEGFWDELGTRCEKLMAEAVREIYRQTGWQINPDSGDQVAELLYGRKEDGGLGIIPTALTDGGEHKAPRGKTDDKTLETIAHLTPVVDLVFDYREPSKVRSSFVVPLRGLWRREREDEGGVPWGYTSAEWWGGGTGPGEEGWRQRRRYHYSLRITRVSSGRLAGVGKPNLLAIPVRTDLGKEVRKGFIAPKGKCIYDIDLNQIEMREMADQSRDEGLVKIFTEGKLDVHTDTASRMFGIPYNQIDPDGPHRYAAKRVGFGVITQITEVGLLAQMMLARAKRPDGNPWTEQDCADMIRLWFEARPAVRRYLDNCALEADNTGMVRSRNGRIRYLPGIWSPQRHVRQEAARQAGSFKISASAQEVIKIAMAHIWTNVCKVSWLRTEPLIQVHDELAVEVPDVPAIKAVVDSLMVGYMTTTSQYPTGIPIKAKGKFGDSWASAK